MDPLNLEIDKYQNQRDQLARELADEDAAIAELTMRLHQFERVLFQSVSKHRELLASWEQRCADSAAIVKHLERCQWEGSPPPKQISDILTAAETPAAVQSKPPVNLSSDDYALAKRIYRSLAKRFHPDLVATSELQSARQALMVEINAAYQNQDLDALEALQHHPDIRATENESIGQRWERLVRDIALIEKKITASRQTHLELAGGALAQAYKIYGLTGASERFEPVRQGMIEQIQQLQKRWQRLRAREAQLWLGLS